MGSIPSLILIFYFENYKFKPSLSYIIKKKKLKLRCDSKFCQIF